MLGRHDDVGFMVVGHMDYVITGPVVAELQEGRDKQEGKHHGYGKQHSGKAPGRVWGQRISREMPD